ncbi:peptidylprolyl isomerase [Flavobacteriaceae bacterium]|nr:peptidylprolyl isomerase [bacterium]MDB4277661.1 peptidylprolyl isomerase [Gammaproteobacteria bacterium]MDB4352782.1 peptidylprolyl isomerase [Porticoccaceae bacterium]MDB9801315.1 peptidylprolyl isomerase [Flavobacteriaceae bacterium]
MSKTKQGDTVKVNYTGKLEDGTIFDTSLTEGRGPIEAKLGEGQLIKGFESALYDMSEGEKKSVEISPEDAYGEVKDFMVSEVPLNQLPEGVKVGEMLQGQGPQGPINVKIAELKEDVAIVDANHPLAGKKLIFDLELVGIS